MAKIRMYLQPYLITIACLHSRRNAKPTPLRLCRIGAGCMNEWVRRSRYLNNTECSCGTNNMPSIPKDF